MKNRDPAITTASVASTDTFRTIQCRRTDTQPSFPTGWRPMLLCSPSFRGVSTYRRVDVGKTTQRAGVLALIVSSTTRRYAHTLFFGNAGNFFFLQASSHSGI